VHLKDVDPRVIDRVRLERLNFWHAVRIGAFCPLGRGLVDFRRVAQGLSHAGYRGFMTIEQDRVPGNGTPLEDLRASLDVLHRVGIGDDGQYEAAVGKRE
jgi:inosose dehydratase